MDRSTKSETDRIEKQVLLRAPVARVWRALTDAQEFAGWFGMELAVKGAFTPGLRVPCRATHPGYEHVRFDITIERMESQRLFSWRWHPHAGDMSKDYSSEPTTLVEFTLREAEGGTLLTVIESGFDGIPLSRRMEAWRGNENGWTIQMQAIERHLAGAR
jgi:uncharacterized protein YndB with AHSA1/START domain